MAKATEQTIDELLSDLRNRKASAKYTNYGVFTEELRAKQEEALLNKTLPQQVPKKAIPEIGNTEGGFALIDQKQNLVDVWHDLSESQACEKFNKMYDEWLAGKDLPEKVTGQIWLIGVNGQGKSCGVLGFMGGTRPK